MPDGVHITGLPGHQIAGSLSVIKGKVLLQQLTVHLVAHLIKCALGCNFKHDLIEEAKHTPNGRHTK